MNAALLLLMTALLVSCVTADAGKLFGKLSKAYMAHKEYQETDAGSMQPGMVQEQPEMTMAEDNERNAMELSMMEQSRPSMEEPHERDNRYNPYYGHHYAKLMPQGYGPGGVVYADDHMRMDVDNEMEDPMQMYAHPNLGP